MWPASPFATLCQDFPLLFTASVLMIVPSTFLPSLNQYESPMVERDGAPRRLNTTESMSHAQPCSERRAKVREIEVDNSPQDSIVTAERQSSTYTSAWRGPFVESSRSRFGNRTLDIERAGTAGAAGGFILRGGASAVPASAARNAAAIFSLPSLASG
jgi:hypothetical protein